jgi:hypothetical protein
MNKYVPLGEHEKFFNVNTDAIAQPTEEQKEALKTVSQAGMARTFALLKQGGYNRVLNPVDYTLSDKEYEKRYKRRQEVKKSRKANR